ncbi:MAG: AAA family ATPase [Candidatus Hydrothermarchaeales archaeon]
MRLYVGLAGKIGSGKTVVSEHLQKAYGATEHRFSEILEDILDRLYLPHERGYLQRLGGSIRKELGHDVIVNAMKKDLETEKADVVVIDGIRYENEVEMLRDFKGILIFVSAPSELRYQRSVKRGTRGEATITFEQFLVNEKAATERGLDIVERKADYVLDNTGTLEELIQNVDGIMREKLGDKGH